MSKKRYGVIWFDHDYRAWTYEVYKHYDFGGDNGSMRFVDGKLEHFHYLRQAKRAAMLDLNNNVVDYVDQFNKGKDKGWEFNDLKQTFVPRNRREENAKPDLVFEPANHAEQIADKDKKIVRLTEIIHEQQSINDRQQELLNKMDGLIQRAVEKRVWHKAEKYEELLGILEVKEG